MLTIPSTWWLMVTRRSHRLPEVLAVGAFAVATAVTLVVLSGANAFRHAIPIGGGFFEPIVTTNAEIISDYSSEVFLLFCAVFASALLIPAALTLGASATRLSLARRDRDLAALRLVGATSAEVAVVTMLDTVAQATIGAIIGVALSYLGLAAVMLIPFRNIPLNWEGLLLPANFVLLVVIAMMLIAAISALISLLGVVTSPLGVARQSRNVRMSIARLLVWIGLLIAAAALMTYMLTGGTDGTDSTVPVIVGMVLLFTIAGGVVAINLAGPFLMWVLGLVVKRFARKPATLVGASRLAADPKSGWRIVSGLGVGLVVSTLTTFMYAMSSTIPAQEIDLKSLDLMHDILVGGFTTLAICAIITGVIAAVSHAAKTFDQLPQFHSMRVAGADPRQINRGRLFEVVIPLVLVIIMATFSLVMFTLPFFLSAMAASAVSSLFLTTVGWLGGVFGSIFFVGICVLIAELTLSMPVMVLERRGQN